MLKLRVTENGTQRRILFSGDISQGGKPLIGDPTLFDQADYVVMESTYSDREQLDRACGASEVACDDAFANLSQLINAIQQHMHKENELIQD
jgi:hypothetical protein